MNTEEPKYYVIAVCVDTSSAAYIPFGLHIERNDELWPNVDIDDEDAARIAENDGIALIYGMDDVEDGVYLDTPENRDTIAASLEKYPKYKLVKLYGRIPEENNLEVEDSIMSYNKAISASDPQAVEKLTAKLKSCEELQETMKGVNVYWRKTGTCMGAPGITEQQAAKLDSKITNATVSWERVPFSDYDIKGNYAEIKRLGKRIAEITRNQEVGFSGWEFEGGRAEANREINRLQLIFDERPDRTKHDALRHAGFVYSHTNGAYQRQLNDSAIYAAGRLDFVKPSDGRTVREHQPKPPAKDKGAR